MKKWISQFFSDFVVWGLLAIAYLHPDYRDMAENGLMFFAWISFIIAALLLCGSGSVAYSKDLRESTKELFMDDSKARQNWALATTWIEAILMALLGMIVSAIVYVLSVYIYQAAKNRVSKHLLDIKRKERKEAHEQSQSESAA